MVAYIRDLVRDIAQWYRDDDRTKDIKGRFVVLAEELDRLDPRDFLPVSRFEFLRLRRQIRALAHSDVIDNAAWNCLKECKDSFQQGLGQETLKRYVLPVCALT